MFLNINIFSLLMTTRKRHWVKTKVKLSFTDVYRVLRDFIKVNARISFCTLTRRKNIKIFKFFRLTVKVYQIVTDFSNNVYSE